MSKQNDQVKEKKDEVRKHLPHWACEVHKMWDEAEKEQSHKSSSLEDATNSKK